MAKGAYIGVDGVAKKIKKGYVGVDGVSRKIKKVYIGIGNVARPCWAGGKLAYYGTITPLSLERYQLTATTLKRKALFVGGLQSGYTLSADMYDDNLTRTTLPQANENMTNAAATHVGDYALFTAGAYQSKNIEAYSDTSTHSVLPVTLNDSVCYAAATSIGDYALFGGGLGSYRSNQMNAITSGLTKTSVTQLSYARESPAAATIGNKAVFAGGVAGEDADGYGTYTFTNEVYDASLTKTTFSDYRLQRTNMSATTVGKYALFMGGYNRKNVNYGKYVTAVDSNLTVVGATELADVVSSGAATSIDGYALFAGGTNNSADVVYAYDENLTQTMPTALSEVRQYCAAATAGDFALFAGGRTGYLSEIYDSVDAYTLV